MDRLLISTLESLLRFPGYPQGEIIQDASVLTCGCLVSESQFNALQTSTNHCPVCFTESVRIISEVAPLRSLYKIITELNARMPESNPSSLPKVSSTSKKSFSGDFNEQQQQQQQSTPKVAESMNLISLFYKFAKEESNSKSIPLTGISTTQISELFGNNETSLGNVSASTVQPITIESPSKPEELEDPASYNSLSVSPFNETSMSIDNEDQWKSPVQNYDPNFVTSIGEEREYNFSKCFPFYRKLSTFPTQHVKMNLSSFSSSFKSGSMMKKNSRFIGSDIHSRIDLYTGEEITRFVLISEKKWELYEYSIQAGERRDSSTAKPRMICCGKLTGEYGKDYNNLTSDPGDNEIVIRNDFGGLGNSTSIGRENSTSKDENKKKLAQWDQFHCALSNNYLIISGTKGVMRVFNISGSIEELGKPLYTYFTNFPIRCMNISPDEAVIACGITARERVSGKEQPFIILHKLNPNVSARNLQSVEPITITIPYRDPIKFINFNSTSQFLICCTVWESRYLIIRLTNGGQSVNYRKPRLIWSELSKSRKKSMDMKDGTELDSQNKDDSDMMMGNEGITDLQFGSLHSNTIILTSCSLTSRPPLVIRLDGVSIDGTRGSIGTAGTGFGGTSSVNSRTGQENDGDEDISHNLIISSETIMKIPEVGSTIHRFALLPRGDGMVFLDKDGHIFLVSTPNFQLHPTSPMKKIVVQLGEAANAERHSESASIKFSNDGGRVFVVDRKGIFLVFDFTKGIPGQDLDVVKCKIVNI